MTVENGKTIKDNQEIRTVLVEERGRIKSVVQIKKKVVLRNITREGFFEYYSHEIKRLLGIESNFPL
ncbi:MAG: hypothetical protein UU12_C0039G0015 [Candidatus Woesebacteria bacterium GW2011_GWA2_40_7b]|uniref:Uncharacterized protein n=1 Tax=Candidatus Woesebacteria bacterium GW2011_GWA2_40_7b TaxID=1618563 RepID=A0A0G0SY11_9BACT|nr:MAG: hypothetical protein UU12_C0039G0015 [Candidatus Woesebacteria bacterium GW2011_GWA2_40_7b]